jgi:hypothetical protein
MLFLHAKVGRRFTGNGTTTAWFARQTPQNGGSTLGFDVILCVSAWITVP